MLITPTELQRQVIFLCWC